VARSSGPGRGVGGAQTRATSSAPMTAGLGQGDPGWFADHETGCIGRFPGRFSPVASASRRGDHRARYLQSPRHRCRGPPERRRGCHECLQMGGAWVHLRMPVLRPHRCLRQLPRPPATAHYHSSDHPLIRLRAGEAGGGATRRLFFQIDGAAPSRRIRSALVWPAWEAVPPEAGALPGEGKSAVPARAGLPDHPDPAAYRRLAAADRSGRPGGRGDDVSLILPGAVPPTRMRSWPRPELATAAVPGSRTALAEYASRR